MEGNQLVSVLMSIYKESVPVVSEAIESVRRQTYPNIEIVVMLDYPEYVEMRTYLAELAESEPRLRYHINEKGEQVYDHIAINGGTNNSYGFSVRPVRRSN